MSGAAAAVTEEMLDVYDENRRPLGRATSRVAHATGLWHRSFHCWMLRELAAGRWSVLLQRRGPAASAYPGYLDISVAGHYQAGEGIEGGLRECAEELGVTVTADQLRLLARRTVDEHVPNGTINREFQDIYVMFVERELHQYRPQFPEVAGVVECDLVELAALADGDLPAIGATGLVVDGSAGGPVIGECTVTPADLIPAARHYHVALLRSLRLLVDGGPVTGPAVGLDDGSRWAPA